MSKVGAELSQQSIVIHVCVIGRQNVRTGEPWILQHVHSVYPAESSSGRAQSTTNEVQKKSTYQGKSEEFRKRTFLRYMTFRYMTSKLVCHPGLEIGLPQLFPKSIGAFTFENDRRKMTENVQVP